ncbi:alpha/beta hydrolase [Arthrobacter sp. ISL-48]|uniref:alpha/beta fold hydrolase n=1 Tax=Arthrobacter sp. ISL-48 TaxID=2819110 RepID=UPI001BE9E667|nr:alpha/beta hydrolase [Arthrobacter sp. ISL-48]MBT2534013.1 alpha/beta hydrolase [Arthrobacter sp. ISL-48]
MITHISGEGRALVAIHGFGVDHRIMLPLEEFVSAAGWQRIYIDLPWASSPPVRSAASAQDVADGVVDEIRQHLGEEPFAVIGNSFGGMIARFVAHELREQVLGLATLAGVFEPDHEARSLPARQILRRDPKALAHAGPALEDYEEMSVIQTEATVAAFTRYALPGLQAADQTVIDRISADYALRVQPEVEYPAPFEAPSLHVFGRQDHVTGYEDGWQLRDHYVRGTYAVLDAAGHNVHLEQPTLTAALVSDWLARIDLAAR